jgi:biotin synthase
MNAPVQPVHLHRPYRQKEEAWSVTEIEALLNLPFMDLLHRAASVHREHHDPNRVQLSTLLSIKTGGCEEDCKYCSQSAHYDTGLQAEKLLELETVVAAARKAKDNGASRFCMGAAWRQPKERHMEQLTDMVREVKALGMETCLTAGMLTEQQTGQLKDAGLDYYNHNLDTSPEFYGEIITTRTYQDRLDTLERVRQAGMKVCSGGIVGLGENRTQRAGLVAQLANLNPPPDSVPINNLIQVEGTPLAGAEALDPFEFVRTIAVARITMPRSMVRLSAGREAMDEALQTLCFYAGANSIFYGDRLLTTPSPSAAARWSTTPGPRCWTSRAAWPPTCRPRLAPGARIAMLSKNCAHFIMAELAIWMAGYTTVAIFPTETAETVRYVLDHSEASLLFVGKLDTWEQQQPGVPAGLPCIALPLAPDRPGFETWDAIVARTPPLAAGRSARPTTWRCCCTPRAPPARPRA